MFRSPGKFLCMLIVLPVALALGGCESLAEKETPLPGERRPIFPEGVPGVDFGAPPPQPSNSNIPIPSSIGQDENPPPSSQSPAASASQPGAQGTSDDAWSGTR